MSFALSMITSPLFRLIGGYTVVHFVRSNIVFNPQIPEQARWLTMCGGSIYGGDYRPPRSPTASHPTLSEDVASWMSSTVWGPLVLAVIFASGGLSGLIGGSLAFLCDGEGGRARYARLKGKITERNISDITSVIFA